MYVETEIFKQKETNLCYWSWQFFSEYDIKTTDNEAKVDEVAMGGYRHPTKNYSTSKDVIYG